MQSARATNRFYHNKLAFTFEQPSLWTVNTAARAIVATAPDNSAELTITLSRRDQATPQSALVTSAGEPLRNGVELDQAGLKGYTAIAGTGPNEKRLAVIDYSNLRYQFEGTARDFAASDQGLLTMIESFRPTHPAERQASNGLYVHYIQVPRGATMASLASGIRIPDAEGQLRLLNGLYPRGEPRTGDWIKVIR